MFITDARFVNGNVAAEDRERWRLWIDAAYEKSYPGIFKAGCTRSLWWNQEGTLIDHLAEAITSNRLVVLEAGGDVIACLEWLDLKDDVAWLGFLAVNPSFQGWCAADVMCLSLLLRTTARNVCKRFAVELVYPTENAIIMHPERREQIEKCRRHSEHLQNRYKRWGFEPFGMYRLAANMRPCFEQLHETSIMEVEVRRFQLLLPQLGTLTGTAKYCYLNLYLACLKIYFSARYFFTTFCGKRARKQEKERTREWGSEGAGQREKE